MIRALRLVITPILGLVLAAVLPGCQFGARRQLDECRRLSQTLRSQNDQLKDQVLAYRNSNQDFSERALDDARRLAQQAETIEELKRSVYAYQADRDEMKTAFREMRDNLPETIRAASAPSSATHAQAARDRDDAPKPRVFKKPSRARVEVEDDDDREPRAGWSPAAGEPDSEPVPPHAAP
jgi:multidrug resistance efflux pump